MATGLRLYFLRHGRADREQFDGADDGLRPLVEEGRRRSAVTARALSRLEPDLDAIVTSPLVRAEQTAAIVADHLGLTDRLRVDPRLAPGFDLPELLEILADVLAAARAAAPGGRFQGTGSLLLVGHEPDFSLVIGELTGGDVVMKKGALARVDLAADNLSEGTLVWLLQPRVLLLAGE
jgi:phosphohistidine phosphatase